MTVLYTHVVLKCTNKVVKVKNSNQTRSTKCWYCTSITLKIPSSRSSFYTRYIMVLWWMCSSALLDINFSLQCSKLIFSLHLFKEEHGRLLKSIFMSTCLNNNVSYSFLANNIYLSNFVSQEQIVITQILH